MDDFCAFILTHGRSERVFTYQTLRRSGYTGPIRLVVDDGDPELERYQRRYPNEVLVFNKAQVAATMDEADNFHQRGTIVYARNVCWRLARENGFQAFTQLDDDYTEFRHKIDNQARYIEGVPGKSVCEIRSLDRVFQAMRRFVETTPVKTIAMAQGGDFIGGVNGDIWRQPKRKAMNSFVCLTDREFRFLGRVNEDVSTYSHRGSRGDIFLTCMWLALQQKQTQANAGGMTEAYLQGGTYVKSIYSVMFQPSSVRIAVMMSKYPRIHHQVRWRYTVPKILHPRHRR